MKTEEDTYRAPAPRRRTLGDVPRRDHPPVVYFLSCGNRVKIGTTTHLRNRVRKLCFRLDDVITAIEGGRLTEQELHTRFAAYRVGDSEWFEDAGELSAYLSELTGTP
jgi:hypothetical protein